MTKTSSFLILFFILLNTFSQEKIPVFKNYTWAENPEYNVSDFTNESIVTLKDKVIIEFFYEDGNFIEYYLEHRVIWLNSDEKIEDYNKVYLPYSNSSLLEVNKARVINPDGKIVKLDESKVLTAKDEESGKQYKYYAFEGIEKGSIIEYYYVEKKYPKYNGSKYSIQTTHPKQLVSFDLYSPSNLEFKFKSYNGLQNVEKDTLETIKNHWSLALDKVSKLDREELSAYHASKQFLVFKLDFNSANNTKDISSYASVAQNLYKRYNPVYDKKTLGLIEAFVEEAKLNSLPLDENLIRKIESYIKTNIYLTENDGDEFSDVSYVLKQKVGDFVGITKLYVALLKHFNIKYELVITSDREFTKFDKKFEAHNFLTDFLIYFPKYKTYLSTEENSCRYGFPPPNLTDNYGLFIKEVTLGEFSSGLGKIKYIKPIPAKNTTEEMLINVNFDSDDLSLTKVTLDRSLNGYYAMYIHPYINLITGEDRDKLVDGFAKNINESIEITNKKVVNDDPNLFGIKPLQFIIDFDSDAFVEKAGRKYLFKVGELIGPQMQMYQEKERVLTVENEFQRSYIRTINIQIPDGYHIANLEDINIHNEFNIDGKTLLSFHSFYEINENVISITADEHYRMNIIPTEHYEAYRTVINSAADFNKITLVVEPNN